MSISLYIYSGLGNVIAIVDGIRESISISGTIVKNLKQIQNVDFDQLIVVTPPSEPEKDFDVKIFNNDGSTASNCINGARCVSKFIKDQSLFVSNQLKINTDGGMWDLEASGDDYFSTSFVLSDEIDRKFFDLDGNQIFLDCVNLGNPHGVIFQEENSDIDFLKVGKGLQGHELFDDGVNFGLAKKVSDSEIDLRVFERGVGETLACGSGACAAAIIGILKRNMISPVKVNFQEGSLLIDYKKELSIISAKGRADYLKKIETEI